MGTEREEGRRTDARGPSPAAWAGDDSPIRPPPPHRFICARPVAGYLLHFLLTQMTMRSTTLLTGGSWAIALLVGCFIWLSPDSPAYPGPLAAAVVTGAAVVVWLAGAIRTGIPKGAPRLSFRRQVGAIAPLLAATLALMLAGRGLLPNPALPLPLVIIGGGAIWWWGEHGPTAPSTSAQELGVALLFIPTVLVLVPMLMLAVFGQSLWLLG